MRKFGLWLASPMLALAISACGGGGDEPAPPPPKPQVTSANGDMSKYLGSWTGCGSRLVGIEHHSFSIHFFITGSAGNIASGTLTIRDFGANSFDCNSNNNAGTTTSSITLTTAPTPVAVQGFLAGTADQVRLSSPGQADQTVFIGFEPDFRAWQLSADPPFAQLNTIRYRKL